jgi:hypothetical protein
MRSPPSPAPLNAFDYRMMALASEFGNDRAFAKIITAFVESRPPRWQRIEAERIKLNEADRLAILTSALSEKVGNLWRPYPDIASRLASLPPPQRALAVIAAFNDEFRNGGVHQFFYNSEGALAPEVHDAMIELACSSRRRSCSAASTCSVSPISAIPRGGARSISTMVGSTTGTGSSPH